MSLEVIKYYYYGYYFDYVYFGHHGHYRNLIINVMNGVEIYSILFKFKIMDLVKELNEALELWIKKLKEKK